MRLLMMFLITPVLLFGALTFETNYQKQVDLLRSFDIDSSFLYDRALQDIVREMRKNYKTRHFFQTMDDAYLFIPMMKNILSNSSVPSEFLFLAMAESNFSTQAYSHKKAAGLWQFMPKTGRHYGLKIDTYVDERRDLVKSTDAAVKYLEDSYKRFGKWYLAAIAYNCGGGRVSRAIKRAGSDDLSVLLNSKKAYLPRESRRYTRKIIALALLGSDENFLIESEYDFLLNRANAFSIAAVGVQKGERLSRVSKILEMPEEELKKLNRHLNYDFIPPYAQRYTIYIPYVKLTEFRQRYKPASLQEVYIVYKVKRGDNLSKIGKKFHVSYKLIKAFNNLQSSRLSLRQKLIIPVAKPVRYKAGVYTVQRGDTLNSIAKSYKVSVAHLKKINHLKKDLIRVGKKLEIYD